MRGAILVIFDFKHLFEILKNCRIYDATLPICLPPGEGDLGGGDLFGRTGQNCLSTSKW